MEKDVERGPGNPPNHDSRVEGAREGVTPADNSSSHSRETRCPREHVASSGGSDPRGGVGGGGGGESRAIAHQRFAETRWRTGDIWMVGTEGVVVYPEGL